MNQTNKTQNEDKQNKTTEHTNNIINTHPTKTGDGVVFIIHWTDAIDSVHFPRSTFILLYRPNRNNILYRMYI